MSICKVSTVMFDQPQDGMLGTIMCHVRLGKRMFRVALAHITEDGVREALVETPKGKKLTAADVKVLCEGLAEFHEEMVKRQPAGTA